MTEIKLPDTEHPATPEPGRDGADLARPGERYFRHPGDVVRLVLWGATSLVLVIFIGVATGTSDGVTTDLGRAAGQLPDTVRELLLALLQIVAIAVPATVLGVLVATRRWRRLTFVSAAAAAGAAVFGLLDAAFGLSESVPGRVTSGTWVASPRFPSLVYVSGVAAVTAVGKPWLARPWRRAADRGALVLLLVMASGGAQACRSSCSRTRPARPSAPCCWCIFGAPNRRPAPPTSGTPCGRWSGGRQPDAHSGRGWAVQLYSTTEPTVADLRQGVRPGQSRCGPPVPWLPDDRPPRRQRGVVDLVAVPRRRAPGAPAAARRPGRRRVPRGLRARRTS